MIKSVIRNLSSEVLLLVIQDARARIDSHVGMSDEPVQAYVDKQRYIIDLVSEELERRGV